MKRGTKIGLWAVAIGTLLAILPVLGLTMIVGSNSVVGLYSIVFERAPTYDEMLGTYAFHGEGKSATIRLLKDGSFTEQIDPQSPSAAKISGRWTYMYRENYADVDFRPFIDPRRSGKQADDYALLCYKPRFGQPYLQLDPDTGDEFRKHSSH